MVQIKYGFDLSKLNTLRLQSTASAYTSLTQTNQLSEINRLLPGYPKYFVLGGGSNLILPESYAGLVIHNQLRGIQIDSETDVNKIITAMAGEPWDNFVSWCCDNEAYGLENLSLIPGTVGASPIQNIGAYGVEVKDFIDHVTVYDFNTGQTIKFLNHECQFSYRNSFFKNNHRYLVISVTFKLLKSPSLNANYGDIAKQLAQIKNPTPHNLRNCIITTRQSKLPDPAEIGNVGSFFHNPIIKEEEANKLLQIHPQLPVYSTDTAGLKKVSAGWLIDNLGLKGYRQGNIGVYHKQALVLVNHEPATQHDILKFANFIQDQVKDKYNIQLNIEPIIL